MLTAAGTLVDAGRLLAQRNDGYFDLSTLREPYRAEGKKTMGLELAEQLGWHLPDWIIYPTGGGTGIVGMHEAFAQLATLGLSAPVGRASWWCRWLAAHRWFERSSAATSGPSPGLSRILEFGACGCPGRLPIF